MNIAPRIVERTAGWVSFATALITYTLTAEPTASFWDCGEYISTAYKLQVGHPPGAPLYQLLGRFFSLFAMGNPANVAFAVNMMSAVASAFTVWFLYQSIVLLGRKYEEKIPGESSYLVSGMALTGSLAFAFTDSFWFSAVEGEVYALSALFTAITFWAVLQWERQAGTQGSSRWLILIAYLTGLSIGVHMLNLLAIPAIALVVYFRLFKPSPGGFLVALASGVAVLAFLLLGLIPEIIRLFASAELWVVNGTGAPFGSGTLLMAILLGGFILSGLYYSRSGSISVRIIFITLTALLSGIIGIEGFTNGNGWFHLLFLSLLLVGGYLLLARRRLLHTVMLSMAFLLIGYSSFLVLVIRSNAGTPVNENNPRDAIGLLAYLNREQYGDWPLLMGPNYNSEITGYADGKPVYEKDTLLGKYIIKDPRLKQVPEYSTADLVLFPRMYNGVSNDYINEYKGWAGIYDPADSHFPSQTENLKFLWNYQIVHMYFRYFMWNFSGRQNDRQGLSDLADGNWISGIPMIDPPSPPLPESLKNKAYNRFYLLPLLIGLAGLYFHFRYDRRSAWPVILLFLMTGLAIVLYLNQYSPQPRERDYAYAASFYAFCIWIGFGVASLYHFLRKIFSPDKAIVISAFGSLLVPALMATEGWDDHDRSGRYTTLEMAKAYLDSCEPNAVLFTNGDNDTFPLWYVQEVENYRTDVRVCNVSLLGLDWYIDQMQRRVYLSPPLPFSLPRNMYTQGTRDVVYLIEESPAAPDTLELEALFSDLKIEEEKYKYLTDFGEFDYFPSRSFSLRSDTAFIRKSGLFKNIKNEHLPLSLPFRVPTGSLDKGSLMLLSFLAANRWQRPVYFGVAAGKQAYMGLEKYFRLEGMAYRLMPFQTDFSENPTGGIDSEVLYDKLMNHTLVEMNDPGVYYAEDHIRLASTLRNVYGQLAATLAAEEKYDSALQVCYKNLEAIPPEIIPYSYHSLTFTEVCYISGNAERAETMLMEMMEQIRSELHYYFGLRPSDTRRYDFYIRLNLAMTNRISEIASSFGSNNIAVEAMKLYETYLPMYYDSVYQFTDP